MMPIEEKLRLTKKGTGGYVDLAYFKSLVGSLRYLTFTRPDINFVVGLICRFMKNLHQSHLQATKRILRYIGGTCSNDIFYLKNDLIELFGYTDNN